MTLSRTRLAPGATRRDRSGPSAVLAILLAVAGAVATLWRPLAPEIGAVVTDLDTFGAATLDVVASYRSPRYAAGLVGLALQIVVPALFVVTRRGRAIVRRLAGPRAHAPWRGGLVALVVTLTGTIVSLPLDYLIGFVHEGEWGFRNASLGLWIRDQLVGAAIGAGAVALVVVILLYLIGRWPRSWPWRMVTIGTGLAAVLVLLQPLVIAPLFSETVPLGPGPVRDEVESVLEQAGVGDLPIEVSDASRRTTRVNAYVSGLGPTRNVVLYDTILELPPEQVGVVVAHELAHREHQDLARGTLLTATALLLPLLLLRRILTAPATAGALRGRGQSDPRLVALIMALAAAASVAGQPVASAISRRAEAAADHRALVLTGASEELIGTARTFTLRDLSQPEPPAWVVFLWATHPTVDQRIRAAVSFAEREGAPLPSLEELQEREADIRHPALPDPADDLATEGAS